jgi:hypothetical protein
VLTSFNANQRKTLWMAANQSPSTGRTWEREWKLLAVDASAIFTHCGNCKHGEFYSSPSVRCIKCFIALWIRPKLLGRIQLLAYRATSPSPVDVKEVQSILDNFRDKQEGLRFRWTSIPFASSVIRTRGLFRMPMI